MTGPVRKGAVGLALALVLAGCGGGVGEQDPGAASAAAAPAPATPAPAGRDAAVCAEFDATENAVRQVAGAAERGPVLPAAVALLLLAPRDRAAAGGVQDPELAAALEELVAAIDDLDAQGRAGVPEGGNAAQDPVVIDTARALAAVEEVQRICAARV
jgi:hypothetical protein